ncbi:LOW QUALITY PROTEIN: hypothetical protein QTO34_000611 [Cnephaeus nilssonii]|uniref:Integrase catalytic domain-containing protein n=1 Tax=Cnephaeus nilssonii TaxID=3371016 RepID=A0AA40ICD2_CNENI|nr:LOW QUALITY PROTEIN: hypothetical protein QTO34_000611 [Eptesicus nilssonii]
MPFSAFMGKPNYEGQGTVHLDQTATRVQELPDSFRGALASDLSKFLGQDLGCILLQYCWEGTRALLRLLTETGYQLSRKRNKYVREKSRKRRLGTERKQAECAISVLSTQWQIWEFLGAAGFGHQKEKDSVSEGNRRANTAAKLASKEQVAPPFLSPEIPEPPKYTPQEEEWDKQEGGKRMKEGWVEAYPTLTEKAREVTKALLNALYGMPLTKGSDNGQAFAAKVVQQVVKALGIKWNLHTAYRP